MSDPFAGYGNLPGMSLSEEVEHRSKERAKIIIAQRKREQMLMDYHTRMDSNTFSIEPMKTPWARVAKPMTAEERFLRKQFLQDQVLSPNEPRFVPEANPKNIFRRSWHTFFNTISKPVVKICGPFIGHRFNRAIRHYVGVYLLVLAFYYRVNYSGKPSWEKFGGWHVYGRRPEILPCDPSWPNIPDKTFEQWSDEGFYRRTTHLDV